MLENPCISMKAIMHTKREFPVMFVQMYLMMVVAESGVAAYYVCFAEDHKVLESNDPALYQYMCDRKAYLDQQSQLS
jgi:hypothetical protein